MKSNKAKRSTANEDQKVALHYMETLVDVAREAFLILDANLRVVIANQTFYQYFRVSKEATEKILLYELGNRQWDIPEFKRLLEEILPQKKVVNNYEVTHSFEAIGERTILLNARQIDSVQLIILALEDVTDRKQIEREKAQYTELLEAKVGERTAALTKQIEELASLNKSMIGRELKMVELKKENEALKKRVKNGNGKRKNGNGNHTNRRQK